MESDLDENQLLSGINFDQTLSMCCTIASAIRSIFDVMARYDRFGENRDAWHRCRFFYALPPARVPCSIGRKADKLSGREPNGGARGRDRYMNKRRQLSGRDGR